MLANAQSSSVPSPDLDAAEVAGIDVGFAAASDSGLDPRFIAGFVAGFRAELDEDGASDDLAGDLDDDDDDFDDDDDDLDDDDEDDLDDDLIDLDDEYDGKDADDRPHPGPGRNDD